MGFLYEEVISTTEVISTQNSFVFYSFPAHHCHTTWTLDSQSTACNYCAKLHIFISIALFATIYFFWLVSCFPDWSSLLCNSQSWSSLASVNLHYGLFFILVILHCYSQICCYSITLCVCISCESLGLQICAQLFYDYQFITI